MRLGRSTPLQVPLTTTWLESEPLGPPCSEVRLQSPKTACLLSCSAHSSELRHLPYVAAHGPPGRHGSGTFTGHQYTLTHTPDLNGMLGTPSAAMEDATILPSAFACPYCPFPRSVRNLRTLPCCPHFWNWMRCSSPFSFDHSQYQDLLCCMAGSPVEDMQDPQDQFLDILQPATPLRTALPIQQAGSQSHLSLGFSLMVVQPIQGPGQHSLQPIHAPHHRHLTHEVGCPSGGLHSPGPLVPQVDDAHQHPRPTSCLPCLPCFYPIIHSRPIQLLSDNVTAIVYITKQGGTRSPSL